MELRRLMIDNFRGFSHFDWRIPEGRKVICLVGPGDSGKTTILDAISWLLGDRWSLPINVFDFHDESKPIVIDGLLARLPDELIAIDKWGTALCGISLDCEDCGEPSDDNELGVHIRLTVDNSFEPVWELVREDQEEYKRVKVSERAKLGVAMLDYRVDSHLRWSNTSALSKVTRDAGGAKDALREATNAAREAMRDLQVGPALTDALSAVREHAQSIGANRFDELKPGIDLSNGQYGGVSLHSGDVPLSSFGLGTKRLTALSIQRASATTKTTFLVDELESGLEPHRTVGLLEAFRRDSSISQAILTTHSQTVVESCAATELAVVVWDGGMASARFIPSSLESLHRSNPSPFLSKRIIVVEGSTEEGLMRAFLQREDEARRLRRKVTSPALGVSLCNGGGGSNACRKAEGFVGLGYRTCLMVDSDDGVTNSKIESARAKGISVLQWPDGADVELAILGILNSSEIVSLLNALNDQGVVSQDRIRKDLEETGATLTGDPLLVGSWDEYEVEHLRAAVHLACTRKKDDRNKGWFKSVANGIFLGNWLMETLDCTIGDLNCRLSSLFKMAYKFAYEIESYDNE